MNYPKFGNVSLGSVTGNIKLFVNEGGVNNLTGIGYNNNSMTFGVNQSVFAIPEMVINQSGNVGIGTTNPIYTLDINGNIRSTDLRIDNGNIHLGQNAGLTSQGANSIAIGYSAGQTTQGIRSIAIGDYAGSSSQGHNSIAIGRLATTGIGGNSIAIGDGATTGIGGNSIAIGTGATTAGFATSVALGAGATCTAANQITLGTAAETVRIPGKLNIFETIGSSATPTNGSLVIQHGNPSGISSIVFPSNINYTSDFGYIQYRDNRGAGGENAQLIIGTSNDGDDDILISSTGGVYRSGNLTTWTQTSDENVKENITIANYDRCFEIINIIDLKRFKYREDRVTESKTYKDKFRLGFIAQDLETVFPKSISNKIDFSGNIIKNITIDQINMALYGCVKSLIQKNVDIQNTNKELESRVTTLESQMSIILQKLQ